MAKMGDIYRSPGRDCDRCDGYGVINEGTDANPQEVPCPKCNPNKRGRAFQ